jgi:hypothetical protein
VIEERRYLPWFSQLVGSPGDINGGTQVQVGKRYTTFWVGWVVVGGIDAEHCYANRDGPDVSDKGECWGSPSGWH